MAFRADLEAFAELFPGAPPSRSARAGHQDALLDIIMDNGTPLVGFGGAT